MKTAVSCPRGCQAQKDDLMGKAPRPAFPNAPAIQAAVSFSPLDSRQLAHIQHNILMAPSPANSA